MISRRLLPNSKFLSPRLLLAELKAGGCHEKICQRRRYYSISPILLAANLVFSFTLYAQSPFYQGKSIRLIAGTQAGSLADLWPRLIADHMGKHIAGNPGIVVQNMPGAGGVIAANYVYNVAKPDGLTLGTQTPSIYMDQIIGRKEIQFDWAKFN